MIVSDNLDYCFQWWKAIIFTVEILGVKLGEFQNHFGEATKIKVQINQCEFLTKLQDSLIVAGFLYQPVCAECILSRM